MMTQLLLVAAVVPLIQPCLPPRQTVSTVSFSTDSEQFSLRDRLRAQFRIVELLEQQQHAMEQMVAEEWVASSSVSFAAQAPDHLFCEKAPEAKMLSASSGRLSQTKKMMHFTSGR